MQHQDTRAFAKHMESDNPHLLGGLEKAKRRPKVLGLMRYIGVRFQDMMQTLTRERAAAVGGRGRARAHERVHGDVARGARPGAAARRVRVVAGAQRLCRALLRARPRAARARARAAAGDQETSAKQPKRDNFAPACVFRQIKYKQMPSWRGCAVGLRQWDTSLYLR